MATPAEMVTAIETSLAATGATVVSVSVDGQTVTYDRAKAIAELDYWRKRAARSGGTRPVASRIKLTGF